MDMIKYTKLGNTIYHIDKYLYEYQLISHFLINKNGKIHKSKVQEIR